MKTKPKQDRWMCHWCGGSGWWTPSTHIGTPPYKDHDRPDGRVCRLAKKTKNNGVKFTIYYQNVHDLKPQVFRKGVPSIREAESLTEDFQDACDGAFREAYEYGPTSVWYEPENEDEREACNL